MQLAFSRDELLSECAYHRPHVVEDVALHGGFDADDHYVSPRSKRRLEAIRGWSRALRDRGGEPHPIDFDAREGDPFLSDAQWRHLIRNGHDDVLWNALTDIGRGEARGRILMELPVPDMQELVSDDIGDRALGHLGRGLLTAHGLDEGGDPAGGLGAHDRMWFLIRDLAMGSGKHPIPAEPEQGRPRPPTRRIPEIPETHEQFLRFLMIVLVLEIRAFPLIEWAQDLLVDPELFGDRASQARKAADLLARIRQDEAIHVSGLRVVLGELYDATLVTADGPRSGKELFAPVWPIHVEFHNRTAPRFNGRMARGWLATRLRKSPDGEHLLGELVDLGDRGLEWGDASM